MTVLRSTSNERIKQIRSLRSAKGRRAAGQSLAEGPKLTDAAVRAGVPIDLLILAEDDESDPGLARERASDVMTVSADVLSSISDTRTPQSPIAVFTIPAFSVPRSYDQVVLHSISDPGNVGAIVRTADALGWDVTLTGPTADPWSPKVIRSSAGSVFTSRMALIHDIDLLEELSMWTVASVVSGGIAPERIGDNPVAILVGSEAAGLPDEILHRADQLVTIPMVGGAESLNAAVAAGLLMYAFAPGIPA
jgi:TrmH family RNA methyltransferase